jgi:hypothetical protein
MSNFIPHPSTAAEVVQPINRKKEVCTSIWDGGGMEVHTSFPPEEGGMEVHTSFPPEDEGDTFLPVYPYILCTSLTTTSCTVTYYVY